MRKALIVLAILSIALAAGSAGAAKSTCVRIQDGILEYPSGHYLEGQKLQIGYDAYGFNYQAHIFNSWLCNVYLGRDGYPPFTGDVEAYLDENPDAEYLWYWYPDVKLQMKWNDAWLSNKDCNGDGALDRLEDPGNDIYGTGAWLTNHQSGVNTDGTHWTFFVKYAAPPVGAYLEDDTWYTEDGEEIGPNAWDFSAVVEVISNDPVGGDMRYKGPLGPGLGKWKD